MSKENLKNSDSPLGITTDGTESVDASLDPEISTVNTEAANGALDTITKRTVEVLVRGKKVSVSVDSDEEAEFLEEASQYKYWDKEMRSMGPGAFTVGEIVLDLMYYEPFSRSNCDPQSIYCGDTEKFISENEEFFQRVVGETGTSWLKKHVIAADMSQDQGYDKDDTVGIAWIEAQLDNQKEALESFLPCPLEFSKYYDKDEELLNEFDEAVENLDGEKIADLLAEFAYNPNSRINADVTWNEESGELVYTTASGGVEIGVNLKDFTVWFVKLDSSQGTGAYSHMRAWTFLKGLYDENREGPSQW